MKTVKKKANRKPKTPPFNLHNEREKMGKHAQVSGPSSSLPAPYIQQTTLSASMNRVIIPAIVKELGVLATEVTWTRPSKEQPFVMLRIPTTKEG